MFKIVKKKKKKRRVFYSPEAHLEIIFIIQ